MEYHLFIDGEVTGPFTLDQLRNRWAEGTVTHQTLFAAGNSPDWRPLSTITKDLEVPESRLKFTLEMIVVVLVAAVLGWYCWTSYQKQAAIDRLSKLSTEELMELNAIEEGKQIVRDAETVLGGQKGVNEVLERSKRRAREERSH